MKERKSEATEMMCL